MELRRVSRLWWFIPVLLLVGCQRGTTSSPIPSSARAEDRILAADTYFDKARGQWLAALIGNYTGLPHEGQYLEQPSFAESIDFVLWDAYPTDDDTLIEWVSLHILEEHGLWPSYVQIRDAWVDHINHDIWWSNRDARDAMDRGILPPMTGSAEYSPNSSWTIAPQIESEIFGVIAPGMPRQARDRAAYFARVTSHGHPVDAAAFYAVLYALAFFEDNPQTLITAAQGYFPEDALVNQIATDVLAWYRAIPVEWRQVRELIRRKYDDDPHWNASKVNFASTLMALLYGEGDFEKTVTIAILAGWDADCNATTSAGLLGTILGYGGLPAHIREGAGNRYVNEDVTGDLPEEETVEQTAARLQAIAEQTILTSGGWIEEQPGGRIYHIPEP